MTLIATTGRAPLRLALAAAVVAALYGAPSAFASTSDSVDNATAAPSAAADSPTAQQPAKLEAMVVTANKRIEKLENVPMSISVMTDAQLQRNNVRELADVINLVPSLTMSYSTTPDNFGINMRGIGTASIGIAVESDVAVIIDDIPYGAQYQAFTDLADVSRIEVLKGPQSTLFGKSAVAGAINITTKPTGGPAGGSASLLYTSDREWRVRASVDASSDKFAFRIAASDTRFPGNVENLTNGQQVNGTGGKTLLGKFTWHALDNLDFEFSPHYNKENDSCCVAVTTSIKPLQGALLNNIAQLPLSTLYAGIPIGTDNHKIRNDFPTSLESTDKGGGLRGIYTFANGATLTGISSFDKYFARDYRDQDFVDAPTLLYYPLANGQPAGVDDGYIQYGIHRDGIRARRGADLCEASSRQCSKPAHRKCDAACRRCSSAGLVQHRSAVPEFHRTGADRRDHHDYCGAADVANDRARMGERHYGTVAFDSGASDRNGVGKAFGALPAGPDRHADRFIRRRGDLQGSPAR